MKTQSFHTLAIERARECFHAADYESVLQRTRELVQRYGSPPFALPVAGGFSEVDSLLDALGRRLAAETGQQSRSTDGGDWILATCIYETGGHTPLMQDLHTSLPEGLSGIVVTLTGHEGSELTELAVARTGLPKEQVLRADASTMVETCRRALLQLGARPPRRLFLFQYPDDTAAVAVAAGLAALGTEIWLFHHADTYPSAGLHLPGLRIIDVTPTACAFVRHVMGLRTTWLPLIGPDPGPPVQRFRRRGHLTTGLSGSIYKTSQSSAISYSEVVKAVLQATGGTHVHIGPMSESQLKAMRDELQVAGHNESQFIHVPVAPTLVEALQSEGVDLLINTWPIGGARAAVEAMSAGVPMVWHAANDTAAKLRTQMAYPEAFVWRDVSELAALAARADVAWLTAQSKAGRQRYESLHHPSGWRVFFENPDAAEGAMLPPGYDASRFLPVLWQSLMDVALDTRDEAIADLQSKLKAQQEKLRELQPLKSRLRIIEQELRELRFPWPVRMWRRWSKRRDP